MIEINGAAGEGGGQILRTALTLSAITKQPFRIINIRANRPKPGLMRQHLVAVQAIANICDAEVAGAAPGSTQLEFFPGTVRGGDYRFVIGTAGSCTLVLQTLLPALLRADEPSTIHISGGTHNAMAPPAQCLSRAYARVLGEMGVKLDIQLKRFGFYPAGGGEMTVDVAPCKHLKPLALTARGERVSAYAESFIAGVPFNVAKRELECVGTGLNWDEPQLLVRGLPGEQGPGNALLATLEYQHVTNVFCAFGEKAVRAEAVAKELVRQVRHYLASDAAVEEHMADQLMLPMALAGTGTFTTSYVSQHALSNADTIQKFLPVRVAFEARDRASVCVIS